MEGNCSLCTTALAQQFCICSNSPLLCTTCQASHETKPGFHFSLPAEALAYVCPHNQKQYKLWLVSLADSQGKLRANLQLIDKCGEVEALYALVQAELEKSRVQLLRTLEELKTAFSEAVEAAIQETSTSDLAAVVWKHSCEGSSEPLSVFTYQVKADDIEWIPESFHTPLFHHFPRDFKAEIKQLGKGLTRPGQMRKY